MFKRLCLAAMIVGIIFLSPLVVSADGVSFLGEICYLVDSGSHLSSKDYEVRFSVLYDGDGHFIVNGQQFGNVLHGTAVIKNNNLLISLTGTGADSTFPQPGSVTFSTSDYIVVDLTTLRGYYRTMGFRWTYPTDNITMPEPYTDQDEIELYVCNDH